MLKNKLKKVSKNVIASLCSLSMLGGLLFRPMPVQAAANTADFEMNIGFYFQLKDVNGGKLDEILKGIGVAQRQAARTAQDWVDKNKDETIFTYLNFANVHAEQIKEKKFSSTGLTNIQIQYDAAPPITSVAVEGKEQLFAYSSKDVDTVTRITKMKQSIIDTVEAVRQNVTRALMSGDVKYLHNSNIKRMVKDPNKDYFEAKRSNAPSDPSNIRFRIIASEEKTEYDYTKKGNFNPDKVIDEALLERLGIPKTIVDEDPSVLEDDESRDGFIYAGFSNFALAMTDNQYIDRSTVVPKVKLKATFPIIIEEIKIPVTYKYVDTTGADVPAELQQKAPKNTQEYVKTSVTAPKAGEQYTPATGDVQVDFADTVTLSDGSEWTFRGWKTDNKGDQESTNLSMDKNLSTKYDDNNEQLNEFVGVWEKTKSGKVTVTYDYVDTDGNQAPEQIQELKPNSSEHNLSEVVTAEQPKNDTVEVEIDNHFWRFNGYTVDNQETNTLTTKAGENKFVGTWEKLYNSSHVFEPADKTDVLPEAINAYLPQGQTKLVNASPVTPGTPTQTTYVENKNGEKFLWTFNSWDKDRETVKKDDVVFTGTWSKEKLYNVTYEFKGIDKSSGTTQVVDAPTSTQALLPSDTADYKLTQKAQAKEVGTQTVQDDEGHTWKFVGFKTGADATDTLSELTITEGDNKFVGYWEKVVTQVSYQFFDKDGGELPDEVTALLPPTTQHKLGEQVTATEPNPTKLTVGNYVWKFNGYQVSKEDDTAKTQLTTEEGDNVFLGQWERLYKVTYLLNYPNATPDPYKEVPEITKGGKVGDDHPTNPTRPEEQEGKEGNKYTVTYTFVGWGKNSNDKEPNFTNETPINDNTTVYAIWKKSTPPFNLTYFANFNFDVFDENGTKVEKENWVKGITDQLPPQQQGLSNGTNVPATEIATKEIKETTPDRNYVWVFEGWDHESQEIKNDNVNFLGVWRRQPLFTVTYYPNYPGNNEPIKKVPDIKKNGTVGKEHPNKDPERPQNGNVTYTFIGWNTNKDGSGESFTPDTKITEDTPVYAIWQANVPVDYQFTNKDEDPLPQEIMDLLPQGDTYAVGTEVTAEQPHGEDKNPVTSIEIDGYKWRFNGYTNNNQEATQLTTSEDGDNTFVGEWERLYKVTYKNNYPGADPENHAVVTDITKGSSVGDQHPTDPSRDDEDENVTWVFKGWSTSPDGKTSDFDNKTPINDNITVYAIWQKTIPSTEYTYFATYDFELFDENGDKVEKNKWLDEIKELVPDTESGKKNGETVTAAQLKKNEVREETPDRNYIWSFKGWDQDTKTIQNDNVHFLGTWRCEPLYTVTYYPNYPGNDTPIKQVPDLTSGSSVGNQHPTEDPTRPNDGEKTYTFVGWSTDPNGKDPSKTFTSTTTIEGDTEVFAIWKENEPVPEQEYSVIHQFVSDDGSTLPEEIVGRTPVNQTGKKTGDTVTPTAFDTSEYRVTEGDTTYIWSFTGWDSPQKEVGTENVTFIGTWSKRVETPEPGPDPDPNPPVVPDPDPEEPDKPVTPDPDKPDPVDPVKPIEPTDGTTTTTTTTTTTSTTTTTTTPVDPKPNPPVVPVEPIEPTDGTTTTSTTTTTTTSTTTTTTTEEVSSSTDQTTKESSSSEITSSEEVSKIKKSGGNKSDGRGLAKTGEESKVGVLMLLVTLTSLLVVVRKKKNNFN